MMKTGKTILSIALAMMMCLAFLGCKQAPTAPTAAEETTTSAAETGETAAAVEPEATLEPEAENPLKGKTINWYTPYAAGDVTDIASRLYQPYIQELCPGSRIMLINEEGAGGILAYNDAYKSTDAAIIASTASALFAFQYISNDPAVAYDMKDFKWLAYLDDDVRVVFGSAASGYKTIYEMIDAAKAGKTLITGTYGKGGTAWNEAVAVDNALDLNLKFVAGYSSSQITIALVQNEINCTCGSFAMYKTYLQDGEVIPLVVLETERSPLFPDTPTIYEVLDSLEKAEEDKETALAILNAVTLPKLIAASPSTTDEEWAWLVNAFSNTVNNAAFSAAAQDTGYNIPDKDGYEITEMIHTFIDDFQKNGAVVIEVFKWYLENN